MKYLIAILAFSTFAFAWVWVFVLNIFIILGGYRSIRRRGYYPVASSLMLACIVAVTNLPIIATFVYLRMLAISSESIWSFSGDLLVLSIGITLLAILPGLACASLVYLLKKRTARVSGPRVIRFPLASRGLIAYGYLLYASIIAVGIFGIYFFIISPKAWYQWAFIVTGWTLLWFSRGREVIISGTQYKTESSIEGVTVTDLRPPVMFLRSFAAESDPFVHAPSSKYPDLRLYVVENAGIDEKARYTQEVDPIINIPLEQYLGATFRERIGPFVALGNPEDYVPPQGASRTYADDEGWYEYFTKISKQAACMVMPVANSSNLEREMTYIRREGLQQRLFIVTTPTKIFQPKTSAVMYKFGELICSTLYGIRFFPEYGISWARFSEMLKKLGFELCNDPGLGSVITFDSSAKANVLITGAVTPIEFVEPIYEYLNQSMPPQWITLGGMVGADDTLSILYPGHHARLAKEMEEGRNGCIAEPTGTIRKWSHIFGSAIKSRILEVWLWFVLSNFLVHDYFKDSWNEGGYLVLSMKPMIALLLTICLYLLSRYIDRNLFRSKTHSPKE